jgi:gamma-glutamyltranspeptidase/glutathione hydrolase
MKTGFPRIVIVVLWLLVSTGESLQAAMQAGVAQGRRGVVATVHPLASAAGMDAFKSGGNAIDAAVAAALTLGVVDGHNSGIGGGCFLLIHRANGEFIAIDGRETAPGRAARDMFIRDGKARPQLSQTGALAVGIPGALAAYDQASRNFGKLPFKDLLQRAAKIAGDGFPISRHYAQRLESTAKELRLFASTRVIFLDDKGESPKEGDLLRQTDLAKTYREIAEQGSGWFYRGRFAELTADWMAHNDGLLTVDDFRSYEVKLREPIRTTYRGYEIIGFPPPSSGGAHVAQMLNILECFDLKSMGAGSPQTIHVVTEAMKLAFADRAFWLGDPDFVKVPRGLISKEYASKLAREIRMDRTTAVVQHGAPNDADRDIFGKHTTHFATADAEGNWVACTATINTSFGSKAVVPGTGVLLNNQMDDFSAQPGVANYFGLLGAEANAVAAGKRPLSSMSPTIVLKAGKPMFSVGAAGGPTIISQVVLAIVNTIDFGMSPEAALAQPRFHQQWMPDEVVIEKRVGEGVLRELEKRGHKLKPVDSIGAAQAIGLGRNGEEFVGVHDPRVEGNAAGW